MIITKKIIIKNGKFWTITNYSLGKIPVTKNNLSIGVDVAKGKEDMTTHKNKIIFNSLWPLSKKRVKIYTGDVIQGCKEWYYHYPQNDVKDAVRRLKKVVDNKGWDVKNKKPKMIDPFFLSSIIRKIFGDDLK